MYTYGGLPNQIVQKRRIRSGPLMSLCRALSEGPTPLEARMSPKERPVRGPYNLGNPIRVPYATRAQLGSLQGPILGPYARWVRCRALS